MVAALEHSAESVSAVFSGRRQLTERRGFLVVSAFATVVVLCGIAAGALWSGLAIAALLLVGSSLVAAEGEPLATRSATLLGSFHVAAVILLTLV